MKKERERVITLVVLSAVLLVVGVYTWNTITDERKQRAADNPATRALQVGEGEAPYTDLVGNTVALDAYVGNVLVVNSWASWSPKSATELPLLTQVADEFKDQDIMIIAINRAEPRNTAERFLRTIGVAGDVQLILDPDDRYYKSISGYAMPETVIYDPKGEIVYHHRGTITADALRRNIQKALESK